MRVAQILYDAGRWQQAKTRFTRLWHEDPNCISCLGYLGGAAAHMGDVQEALRISGTLSKMERPYLRGLNTMWCARIAAALGRQREAVQYVQAARAQGQAYGLYLHTDPDLLLLQDNADFKELMQPAR